MHKKINLFIIYTKLVNYLFSLSVPHLNTVKHFTVKHASNGTCMNRNTVNIGKFSWSRELRHNINVNLLGYSGTWLTRKRNVILRF